MHRQKQPLCPEENLWKSAPRHSRLDKSVRALSSTACSIRGVADRLQSDIFVRVDARLCPSNSNLITRMVERGASLRAEQCSALRKLFSGNRSGVSVRNIFGWIAISSSE